MVRCPIASRFAERSMALLARPLPVADGLLVRTRLGRVMRQQLGLRLTELGKARLQDLSNALMVLLPGAAQ